MKTSSSRLRPCVARFAAALAAAACIAGFARNAAAQDALAVNFVAIDAKLHTAGQPDEAALATLGTRGYDLVVNLAPAGVTPSKEAEILAANGVRYVNIPVDWRNPTAEDFAAFSRTLAAAGDDDQVLVHCQMNMRASVFTFLHRVTHDRVDPAEAFKAVKAVWTPNEGWTQLAREVLGAHGIAFDF
jgi:protein tyrosine phosphatase (PTP) superfamily phosphohydrolase (DUF442 family)